MYHGLYHTLAYRFLTHPLQGLAEEFGRSLLPSNPAQTQPIQAVTVSLIHPSRSRVLQVLVLASLPWVILPLPKSSLQTTSFPPSTRYNLSPPIVKHSFNPFSRSSTKLPNSGIDPAALSTSVVSPSAYQPWLS